MAKKKKVSTTRLAMFAVGMVIGLGLIIFDQFETIEGIISGTEPTGLAILTVPVDPTTGGILGTIVLGAPDVVPFEQAGTMIGIPRVSTNYPQNPCTLNLTNNQFPFRPPDFGRRLAGERNQINPVWWGSTNTGVTNSYDCGFAYAQWDIVDIPNDFVATSVVLKLEILEARGIRNTNNPAQECRITIQDFNIDTIADEGVIDQLYAGFPVVSRGTWCNKIGVNSFQFGQGAVDLINDAISGGAFDQGVRSDKLLLGFLPHRFDNLGVGQNKLSTDYWKTEGSLFLTGSSSPIKCNVGFTQVDFRCEPLICISGQQVNATTNECESIICSNDEELLGNICTPIICNVGEFIVGGFCIPIQCGSSDQLVGSECIPLICDVGFEAKQNECVVKTCGTGLELIQDTCQAIVCPSNTILNGNDCIERSCPIGQISVNNECSSSIEFGAVNVNDPSLCPAETVQVIPLQGDGTFDCIIEQSLEIECVEGKVQVGDECLPIIISCSEGFEQHENVCRQIVPDPLTITGAPELGFVTILGIVIFGGSMFGLVGATRRV